jgi:hypothetical protein
VPQLVVRQYRALINYPHTGVKNTIRSLLDAPGQGPARARARVDARVDQPAPLARLLEEYDVQNLWRGQLDLELRMLEAPPSRLQIPGTGAEHKGIDFEAPEPEVSRQRRHRPAGAAVVERPERQPLWLADGGRLNRQPIDSLAAQDLTEHELRRISRGITGWRCEHAWQQSECTARSQRAAWRTLPICSAATSGAVGGAQWPRVKGSKTSKKPGKGGIPRA